MEQKEAADRNLQACLCSTFGGDVVLVGNVALKLWWGEALVFLREASGDVPFGSGPLSGDNTPTSL